MRGGCVWLRVFPSTSRLFPAFNRGLNHIIQCQFGMMKDGFWVNDGAAYRH